MSRILPEKPNLEHIKNEAKSLLKVFKKHDPKVCSILRNLNEHRKSTDAELFESNITLQQVQHALAKDYGFAGWKNLLESFERDEELTSMLIESVKLFSVKGPDNNSTGSDWEKEQAEMRSKIHQAGDKGFQIMLELAKSKNGRLRKQAVLLFAFSNNPESLNELKKMLSDSSDTVRSKALRFFAMRIHPNRNNSNFRMFNDPAFSVPYEISTLFPLLQDKSEKVRMQTIQALSAYANLDDNRILDRLNSMLEIGNHKLQHAAAKALALKCTGCGKEIENDD